MKKTPAPPRWADRLLEWRLSDRVLEEVQGDLYERFHKRVKVWGEKEARRQYAWEVLGFLRPRAGMPFARKRGNDPPPNYTSMLTSYFITAFRNIRRNAGYASLNVLGLALGIAACLVIFIVVRNELSYDTYHRKANRTYRVTFGLNPSTSLAVVPALRNDFPELEQVAMCWYPQSGQVRVGNMRYNEKGFAYADQLFTHIFDYQWLAGNPQTALSEPNTVVLTERIARKYFGDQEAMGQVITLDNQKGLKVTGIIKDLPGNTHLPFSFLVSFETVKKDLGSAMTQFYWIAGSFTYIVLPENYSAEQLQKRMPAFIAKNWGKDIAKESQLLLQPLKDIHFDVRYSNNAIPATSRETYWALSGIAVFIIVTACINFINLATAQAIKRAKEVGVRKVLGANRTQLIGQFLGETILLVLLALGLGLIVTGIFLPQAAQWLSIKIDLGQLAEPVVMTGIATLTLLVILLAGLYPAFVQSSFRPVESLKSQAGFSFRGLTLRKCLVVVQFAISQTLIVGTLVVAYQMDYFRNQDLGFNKESVITFGIPDRAKLETLKQQLRSNPGVKELSLSSGAPSYNSNFGPFTAPELGIFEKDVTEIKFIDEQYIDMFGLKMLAGEKITKTHEDDTTRLVIVNETMMHKLGIQDPNEAIDKHLMGGKSYLTIKGVIQDFQSESKHGKRRPCVLMYQPQGFFTLSVRLQPKAINQTIASIEKDWSALFPNNLFEYEFLDEHIAQLYKQEQKVYTAFKLFSSIAILIGCLGLYGLVTFAVVQRTKEVGIRKVLGASILNIVSLFAKEFILLIVIAFLFAAPISFYFMNNWLANFAYHIHIGSTIFLMAIAVSFTIAAGTIAYQAIKAALANPVKSLRTE